MMREKDNDGNDGEDKYCCTANTEKEGGKDTDEGDTSRGAGQGRDTDEGTIASE